MAEEKDKPERQCSECGSSDGVMWLHSACHPQTPLWVKQYPNGDLVVVCAEPGCEAVVMEIKGMEGSTLVQ